MLQKKTKLREIRKFFPITRKYIYFANANYYPLTTYSLREMNKILKKKKWGKIYEEFFNSYVNKVKSEITSILAGDPSNIIFFRNSTEALFFILTNLIFNKLINKGDQILTYEENFPSLINIAKFFSNLHELSLKKFSSNNKTITLDKIKEVIDEKTKILILSHVDFISGNINEIFKIGEFLEEKEIIFIVDITQSAGIFPFSFNSKGIDFYICSLHKGIGGIDGGNFTYYNFKSISKKFRKNFLDKNFNSFENFDNKESFRKEKFLPYPGWKDNRVFNEQASIDILPLASIYGNFKLMKFIGISKILKYNRNNYKFMKEFFFELLELSRSNSIKDFKIITDLDYNNINQEKSISVIFSIQIFNNELLKKLKNKLNKNKIIVNFFDNYLRISFSYYNSEDEFFSLKNIILNELLVK